MRLHFPSKISAHAIAIAIGIAAMSTAALPSHAGALSTANAQVSPHVELGGRLIVRRCGVNGVVCAQQRPRFHDRRDLERGRITRRVPEGARGPWQNPRPRLRGGPGPNCGGPNNPC